MPWTFCLSMRKFITGAGALDAHPALVVHVGNAVLCMCFEINDSLIRVPDGSWLFFLFAMLFTSFPYVHYSKR